MMCLDPVYASEVLAKAPDFFKFNKDPYQKPAIFPSHINIHTNIQYSHIPSYKYCRIFKVLEQSVQRHTVTIIQREIR